MGGVNQRNKRSGILETETLEPKRAGRAEIQDNSEGSVRTYPGSPPKSEVPHWGGQRALEGGARKRKMKSGWHVQEPGEDGQLHQTGRDEFMTDTFLKISDWGKQGNS